jgi:acyl carrier protein
LRPSARFDARDREEEIPMTQDEILARMTQIFQDSFDIEPGRVRPEARLYDDLDIDSIDAVDLIVQLKPLVGRRLQPEAFKSVRTVQDVVDALHGLIHSTASA